MYKLLITVLPIFLAFLVAISRTRDYRHNFSDVLAGMIIGVFSAVFGYFLHYPGLGDVDCGIAKNRIQAIDFHQQGRQRHPSVQGEYSENSLLFSNNSTDSAA